VSWRDDYLVTIDPNAARATIRSRLGRREVRAPDEASAAQVLVDLVLSTE
jgi:hypothetical protein